jgi:hypothetical protein
MVLFSAIDAAMAFPTSGPRPFEERSSCVKMIQRKVDMKDVRRLKNYELKNTVYCKRTKVMVVFLVMAVAMNIPSSGPRLLEERLSYRPEVGRRNREKEACRSAELKLCTRC